MSATIKADGDTWRAELAAESGGGHVLVFFCTSTDQRPYRVLEIEAGRFGGSEDLERISDGELEELFRASTSMGAPKGYPTYGP